MTGKRDKLLSRRTARRKEAKAGQGRAGPPAGIDSRSLARRCAEASLEKKAEDVVLLDLRGISTVCDVFVLASGLTEAHVWAIAEWIRKSLEEEYGVRPWHVEGTSGRRWVLLDYVDWVVHIFHRETREFYQLERLWGDAPREVLSP